MSLRFVAASLFAFAALGLGLLAWQAVRPVELPVVAHQESAPPPPLTVNVLVAAHALPAGTLLKDVDFAQHAVEAAQVGGSQLTDTPDVRTSLRGALVRRWIDAGEAFATDDVLRPRDRGFLAAVLAPGTRAIAVGVDAVSGTGGLIWPGDRVDLLLTQDLGEKDTSPGHRVVGETVLTSVRVVAVDQSITQGAATDAAPGKLARTVTLEVSPEQAERAAVAQALGKLTLTLRSAEELGVYHPKGVVYGSDVSSALTSTPAAPVKHMRVIQGSENQEVNFR
jgi:pilus assembly protein CpaB